MGLFKKKEELKSISIDDDMLAGYCSNEMVSMMIYGGYYNKDGDTQISGCPFIPSIKGDYHVIGIHMVDFNGYQCMRIKARPMVADFQAWLDKMNTDMGNLKKTIGLCETRYVKLLKENSELKSNDPITSTDIHEDIVIKYELV